MSVSFRETTRGSGKIFVRVEGLGPSDGLNVASSTSDGTALPATWHRDPQSGYVVAVVPVLAVDQTLTVVALDAAGNVEGAATKTIRPRMARLASQVNTATRNGAAASIRNSDARAASTADVRIYDLIPFDADVEVIHCEVCLRGDGLGREVLGNVRLLDSTGSDALLAPLVCLGDKVVDSDEVPGLSERRVAFSARVRSNIDELVLCLSAEEGAADPLGARGATEAFCVALGHDLAALRGSFYARTLSADRDPEWEGWFLRNVRASEAELQAQRRVSFEGGPLFSLIVPLYKTPLEYFDQMLESVLAQTYGRLELVLVNASPEDERLAQAVSAACERDARVRVLNLDENRGITLNTNEGIRAASGDFLCFLDHDDVIEPDLLYHYARGIERYPRTDLLYCDEDKLIDGHFCQAFLKPDWSPDLLCSCNYVCHLLTVRKSVVDGLELPDGSYDGAQDQNMTLRVGELARNVFHARKVLYHWRVHPQSTAADPGSKSYTSLAGVKSVQEHLDRCGIDAVARMDERTPNVYHVDYQFAEHPLVSIVIPNKDQVDVLDRCLASIAQQTTYPNYEVIVVENNSTEDETFLYYEQAERRWERVRVVREKTEAGRFNFARTVNFGFSHAKGDYFLMLNNDTEVITPGWLEQLVGPCRREDIGAVGCKLLYPDGLIQHAGVFFHFAAPGHFGKMLPSHTQDYFNFCNLAQDLTAVTGACLMTSRETYEAVGGMDETFAVEYNDIDLCLRIQGLGKRVLYNPDVEIYHYESISRGQHRHGPAALRSCRENGRMMQMYPRYFVEGDPYLNPGLVRMSEHRALKKYLD